MIRLLDIAYHLIMAILLILFIVLVAEGVITPWQ